MVFSISYKPTRHNRSGKTFATLATTLLALSNTNTVVSASPAPIIVPPASGNELLNIGTTNLNSTSTVTIAPASSITSISTLVNATTSTSNSSSSWSATSSLLPTETPTAPNPNGVLALPLKHVELGNGLIGGTIARRYFSSEVLSVYSAAYLAQITFPGNGNSSPQVVDVLLDTGSFELFVNPVCSDSDVPRLCESFGSYNASDSPTAENLNKKFDLRYGSGAASGGYYKDSITLAPGTTITDQQFGVANSSEHVWFGIMGLGQGRANNYLKYPLIVDTLMSQGFTASRLFSLELGQQTPQSVQNSGEIVFGGLDRNKFAGNLVKVATNPREVYYSVQLASLTNNPANGSPQKVSSSSLTVIVDSGTTLSVLPRAVVESLAAKFPGAQPGDSGDYIVPCSYRNQQGSVSFEFADTTINVSYQDFIWVSGSRCILGAVWSDSLGLNILGATFLRGTYAVFDQDNSALYMAEYQSCGNGASNLVPVPQGTDEAARIVGACAAVVLPPGSSTTSTSTTSTSTSTTTVRASTSSSTSVTSTSTRRTSATGAASALATPTSTRGSAPGGNNNGSGPDVTITSTITRPVTYTISSCTPGINTRDCTVGALATTWEVFVTEICLQRGPNGELIPHNGNGQAGQFNGNGAYPTATTTAGNQGIQGAAAVPTGIPEKETVTVTVNLNSDCAATVLPVTAAVVHPGHCTTCSIDEEEDTTITVRPFTAAADTTTTSCDSSTLTIKPFATGAQNAELVPFPSDQFPYGPAPTTDSTATSTRTRTRTGRPAGAINAAAATPKPSGIIGNSPIGNSLIGNFNTTIPSPITAAANNAAAGAGSQQSAQTLFAYTTMPDTVETVTASVVPIKVTSGSDASRGRRRAGGREEGMWLGGQVDVKIFVGVGVAILGAWL